MRDSLGSRTMTVQDAIHLADAILPGAPAPEGQTDPRWQRIIAVGEYIQSDPEAVWEFVVHWGSHADGDLRAAIATCLLEHLLQSHFESLFPRVELRAGSDPLFADTVAQCWKFGQAATPANAARFDELVKRITRGSAA
jgi:hypothetical protein